MLHHLRDSQQRERHHQSFLQINTVRHKDIWIDELIGNGVR